VAAVREDQYLDGLVEEDRVMLDENVSQLWKRMWLDDEYLGERLRCIDAVIALACGNPIVAVVGSAKDDVDPKLSEWVGSAVAESGFYLLTGGRGGVMRDVTRGFLNSPAHSSRERPRGRAIAVLPQDKEGNGLLPPEYVVQTYLPGDDPLGPATRNHVNIITAEKVVVLPGGTGTASEAKLAGCWYKKPTLGFHDLWTANRAEWNEWRRVLGECGVGITSDRQELLRFIGRAGAK
jgi:uncharacterized protein (TIGR00725 family)